MPKIVIPKSELPPLDGNTESYFVRFRITTEDRNNSSYWSPIFQLSASVGYTSASLTVNYNAGIITAAWLPVSGVSNYDVWIAWDDGTNPNTWSYYGRTSNTSIVLAKKTGATKISVRIYQETQPVAEFANFKIYQTLNTSV